MKSATCAVLFVCIGLVCGSCTHGSVRLMNGSTSNQGRVEVCVVHIWGTVCDDYFDSNDAKVVCRQLQYDVDKPGASVSVRGSAYYEQGSGPIWLDDVYCTGRETNLLDCRANTIGVHNCGHHEDVGVICPTCTSGNVRLIGGLVPTEGTVQMCVEGRWRELCYSGWGYQEAFVVCRQLGLPATAATAIPGTQFSVRSLQSFYSSFRCYGKESSLMDCLKSSSPCTSSRRTDAAVRCAGDIVLSGSCSHGNVRLVGPNGPNTIEGRVEYCSNGLWGTVSNSGFDSRDGEVVCRRLGHQNPRVQLFTSSHFGQGSGPIFFIGLSCTGTEYSLSDCPHSYASYYYSHSSDIGARCLQKVVVPCTHGAVRLVNGSTSDEGRVEICINGEWGAVCHNGWERREAQVVCRQLGYNPPWANYYTYSRFGDGKLPILAQSFSCTGTESSLLSCGGTTSYSSCYYGRVAGVRCFRGTGCTNGKIRLVGGQSEKEGAVQICVGGVWGHVCSYGWHSNNARVVCRQLGYSTSLYGYSRNLFSGGSSQPIIYDSISCTGSEQRLSDCTKYVYDYGDCPLTYLSGVMCEVPSNCTSWDVRLVNGSSDIEGRVEVCYSGVWTTVSSSRYPWDYNDARVVCRQLGFQDKWAAAITRSYFGTGNRQIVYSFRCSGSESSLQSCTKRTFSSSELDSWYNHGRAAVECQAKGVNFTTMCTIEGATRLVGGSSRREGRVEVCMDGHWGTVCSNSWTEEDAYVVCRQTGTNFKRANAIIDGRFGKGVGPVHMSSVNCRGDEMKLRDCSHSNGVGVTNCHHGRDAGVVCEEAPLFYQISVEVQPPQDSIPIGIKVILHCRVSPTPVQPVTYEWRTTVPGATIVQFSTSLPNATTVIQSSHLKYGYYYCLVKHYGATLGTGVIRIEVENILLPAVPVPLLTTVGTDVILRVNVTKTTSNTYLRELNWYHNGQKITPTSSTRTSLSSDNTSMTITNVTDEDGGEYSVQFDGLRVYPYDQVCERQTLSMLRQYPLLAPAVLFISTDGGNIKVNKQPSSVLALKQKKLFNGSTPVSLGVTIDQYAADESTAVYWYHNGGPILWIASVSSIRKLDAQAELNIQQPTVLHTGVYETQLRIRYHSRLTCGNPSPYYSFLYIHSRYRVVIGSDVQQLLYSEIPRVEFTAQRKTLPSTLNTSLTCTAVGGYPPVDSITLYRNNALIMRTSSSGIHYETQNIIKSLQYGKYRCLIDTKITVIEKELLLQEEARMIIVIRVEDCSMWNNSQLPDFESSVLEFFTNYSSFLIQGASFANSSLLCKSSSLTFTSTLIYSSDDGLLTASDLINLMEAQVLPGRGTATLTIRGVELPIQQVISQAQDTTVSPFLRTLLFGGAGVSSLIWLTIIMVLIMLILKMRRKKRTGTVTSSTEARYISNSSTVTITKTPLNEPTSSKPLSHHPPNPSMKGRSSQATKTVEAHPPSLKYHSNPSYNSQAFHVDNHLYKEPDVAVGGHVRM